VISEAFIAGTEPVQACELHRTGAASTSGSGETTVSVH
jgi:hypothetical protein